ncbi:conserved hypothetical protein [Arthrobacter sp. 9AX]|uniref:hypothetical protein n=1 Tax=Arthrobacter sp. 9AX TaxID=2653131 RepID=UPI0012F230D1|nr:hypothetical protein [Arthrobacter sp. 9AX]VXC57467.1 conserved hypothetical protein [Arthrobacter sp. 9AX]
METLKKIVSNQYFPAAAVLTAVVLFWAVGMLGGLSLLNNNQPPLTTLTWMLFVYLAAVLTPIAGVLAAIDLVRRWKRNRAAEAAAADEANAAEAGQPVASAVETAAEFTPMEDAATEEAATAPVPQQPAGKAVPQQMPVKHQQPAHQQRPAQKKPVLKKSGSKKAA